MNLYAILVGVTYTLGIYLVLRRSLVKTIIGIAVLGVATNLLIFFAVRPESNESPIIPAGQTMAPSPAADPVPQALILTAIVISFGVLSYTMVLVKRAYQLNGTDDPDAYRDGDD